MPQIEVDIENVIGFLDTWYHTNFKMNNDIIDELKDTMYREVFNYDGGNKTISTKAEMRRLISGAKGSASHSPSEPRQGKFYSPEYLVRKASMGEVMPHKYKEYGFWHGINFRNTHGSVIMKVNPPETSESEFDYLTHHEKRRSVVKLTFVKAWQRIIKIAIKRIIKGMKSK